MVELYNRQFINVGLIKRCALATLTDFNMLNLKFFLSPEITTHTFTKHEEGKNGGDWEWWLSNSSRTDLPPKAVPFLS
jgi:hypothetical protein